MKKFLLFLIILFPVSELIGCTCYPPYYVNFFETITLHPLFIQSEKNIVKAEIISISDDYNFVEIKVLKKI